MSLNPFAQILRAKVVHPLLISKKKNEEKLKGGDWSISCHENMHSLSFLCKAMENNGSKI